MADNELERIYTIPLRHAHHGKRSKRADRAIKDVRTFLTRHMKSDNIWLANEINETLWARGKYTIPSKIRVRATRFADGVVEVTLPETDADGSVREQLAERREKAQETPVLAPMDTEDEHVGSDVSVTEVEGIGPATAAKLEEAGIESVADLAHASPDDVAAATGKTAEAVEPWIAAAHAMLEEQGHSHGEEE